MTRERDRRTGSNILVIAPGRVVGRLETGEDKVSVEAKRAVTSDVARLWKRISFAPLPRTGSGARIYTRTHGVLDSNLESVRRATKTNLGIVSSVTLDATVVLSATAASSTSATNTAATVPSPGATVGRVTRATDAPAKGKSRSSRRVA